MADKFEYEILDGKHPDLVQEELAIPIQYMVIVRPGVAWDEHYVSMVDDRCYITLDFKDYPIVKIGKEQAGIRAIYDNGGFNLSQLSDVFEKFPYLKHIQPEYLQAWAKENLLVVYHHSTPEELENGYAKISSEFMLMPMECALTQITNRVNYDVTYDQRDGNDDVRSFGKAIKTCFAKAFDFSGRASRTEFWYFQLYILLGVLGIYVYWVIMPKDAETVVLDIFLILFGLINLCPNLAVGCRRMHDAGLFSGIAILPDAFLLMYNIGIMENSDYLMHCSIFSEILLWILACKSSVQHDRYGVPVEQ